MLNRIALINMTINTKYQYLPFWVSQILVQKVRPSFTKTQPFWGGPQLTADLSYWAPMEMIALSPRLFVASKPNLM